MRRALLVLVALALTGCGLVGWFIERSGCGLKCPANSSCKVVQSGVFTASYGCECDHGLTKGGSRFPSKADQCPITPAKEK